MDCLFCKIAQKMISTEIVYEDSRLIAFNDLKPQAPVHILVIPKIHYDSIEHMDEKHHNLIGRMILCAKDIAASKHINDNGYRLIFNVNNFGGQTVYHTHLHLLGGRQMAWPPG